MLTIVSISLGLLKRPRLKDTKGIIISVMFIIEFCCTIFIWTHTNEENLDFQIIIYKAVVICKLVSQD
jgi:hypothetical protein